MLAFALLYLLNTLLPLGASSYTTRIWNWTEWTLGSGPLLPESGANLPWFIDFVRFFFGY